MLASVVQATQGCQDWACCCWLQLLCSLMGLAVLPLSPFCGLRTQNQELLSSRLLPRNLTLSLPAEVVCLDNVLLFEQLCAHHFPGQNKKSSHLIGKVTKIQIRYQVKSQSDRTCLTSSGVQLGSSHSLIKLWGVCMFL